MEKQKKNQRDWYNNHSARCSLERMDENNEVHLKRLKSLIVPAGDAFSSHRKVLEIGCGSGWYSGRLGPSIGVDISYNSLRGSSGSMAKLAADAEKLPFKDSSFDLVFGFGILHHLDDIEKGLKDIHRVLKPGGKIAFGGENNGSCLLNYIFPLLYGNWNIEKGFTRIKISNLEKMLKRTGFKNEKFDINGFAVYGLNEPVFRITKFLEGVLQKSKLLKSFSGFVYLTAAK